MQLAPRAVHIYTDGSCYRNPGGSSGCAAIVQCPEHLGQGDEQIVDFGCSESSNNRMELLACIQVLKWIRKNSPWPDVSYVQVVTDSRYVKDSIIRASGWRKNGWRNQFGEPIENRDLWKEFLSTPPHRSRTRHPETKSNLSQISMQGLNIRTHSREEASQAYASRSCGTIKLQRDNRVDPPDHYYYRIR